jgi:hypothetical protein
LFILTDVEKDFDTPLPNAQQIDAVLLFAPMFADPGTKHSRWHIEPGKVPWCELGAEATAFWKALHENGFIVGFDWSGWQEEARKYFGTWEYLGHADLSIIRRLCTLHVRKNRFCEGHFAAMIVNGHFAAILDRLSIIRVEMDGGLVLDDRILDEPFVPPDQSESHLPWEDVEASRRNRRLQRKHPIEEGKTHYLANAKPCPKCQTPAEALAWFYFESPNWTWENLCGRAGWLIVCDRCRCQTDFFEEAIS